MTSAIPLNLAVEDALTEFLLIKIIRSLPIRYAINTVYNRGGSGYIKKTINGFNNAAKGTPFLIGTDLDQYECPAALTEEWLSQTKHENLLIMVAVREAEAWVLADKENFARFLGIRLAHIREDVEDIADPKQELIKLARTAKKKELREDLCPPLHSTRRVGPNYNSRLGAFVQTQWNPNTAKHRSPSLARALDRLTTFRPTWPRPTIVL